MDLFTSAERTDFRDGVATIKSAYEKNCFTVRVDVCSDHFARLWATDTHSGESGKVELAADIRSKAPVTMSIGPVVHVDDVAGGKMEALFTRAEARDFIDIDAIVTSGRFTRTRLQELAASRDAGFDHRVLADMLDVINIYPDAEFPVTAWEPGRSSGCESASPNGGPNCCASQVWLTRSAQLKPLSAEFLLW